ncbi:hypothetical protein VPH35_090222 [Triticum aestivum]
MEGAGSGGKMGGGEGMAGRAGAGAAWAAKEKTGFAATCSLLSRYMKEKKGGALQGLVGLDMSPPAAVVDEGGAFQPPTTMNLLSGLEEPNAAHVELPLEKSSVGQFLKATTDNQDAREDAHQLTIFYGGKVVVVDNFPSTKVKDLLQMADGAGDKAGSSSLVQQSPPQPSQNTLPGTNSHALFCNSTVKIYNTCRQRDCFSSESHANFHMKSLSLTECQHFLLGCRSANSEEELTP